MRCTVAVVATLALAATGCEAEPTGPMWTIRSDDEQAALQQENVTLLPGGGLEIKETANATVWHPTGEAEAPYQLTARVGMTNLALHAHGAGIVFGGSDVTGDAQTYTYFLVRGDGHYLVKTRDGTETGDIQPWTEHAAIVKEDSDQKASNALSVSVQKDETSFFVNDTEVFKHTNKDLHVDGKYGVRMVHDLRVRFDQIELTPGPKQP